MSGHDVSGIQKRSRTWSGPSAPGVGDVDQVSAWTRKSGRVPRRVGPATKEEKHGAKREDHVLIGFAFLLVVKVTLAKAGRTQLPGRLGSRSANNQSVLLYRFIILFLLFYQASPKAALGDEEGSNPWAAGVPKAPRFGLVRCVTTTAPTPTKPIQQTD
jgi:hypothetical protein